MGKSRNVYPNEYVINYEDYKGKKHKQTMRGLTADEAVRRFRSKHMTAKNVTAARKWKKKSPKISSLFH